MKKRVIDEKLKQNQDLQDLKEYFKKYTLELADESIIRLIKYEDELQNSKTIKQVIDEKIKQNQVLKEDFSKSSLGLTNESIIHLLNIAINDLETIKFLYLHELKVKENIKND